MSEDNSEATALEFKDRAAWPNNKAVRIAYLASDGCPGFPWIDALAEACRECEIDI